jgi:AbiJ N-terminal domain 4
MLFSERNNLVQLPTSLELDEISSQLKNSLWNEITEWQSRKNLYELCYCIWKNFFKLPVDKMPVSRGINISYSPSWEKIRDFFFEAEWYEVYDFIEFLLNEDQSGSLSKAIDKIMVIELASYRIVNKQFIPVTSLEELESIETSISLAGPYENVAEHFRTALMHLSNRENPDYRNSIKESISAVEATAKQITGKPKATLDEALKKLEKEKKLHGSLQKGYQALYGYTSDSDGIRHSLMEESNLTIADAKYFLISCSAFVNYLKTLTI